MSNYGPFEAPTRPQIRKRGTVKCDVVETTPIVFHDTLYRMECIKQLDAYDEQNPDGIWSWMQFVDVRTDTAVSTFGHGNHFGTAFVVDDMMYTVLSTPIANEERGKYYRDWGGDTLIILRSRDLIHWEEFSRLTLPGHHAFNTGVCKMGDVYTLLIEMEGEVGFSFRFAQSTDLKNWTFLPEDYMFQKHRYAGGPAIYTLPDDPHYYLFYLEANPGPYYTNCIARSTDLMHWEYSRNNPVLMFDDSDKQLANPFLTVAEQERIRRAWNCNNSDLELCEFNGRTILYYSWGCQMGNEFLAEACYEGSMKDFIHAWFD